MMGMPRSSAALRAVGDGRDHRDADAGDDARRADRPGADADLHRVDAAIDERARGLGRGDVAGDQIDVRMALAHLGDHVEDALRVAVRGVDDEHVDVGLHERGRAVQRVLADAHRRAHAQAAQCVLAGVRVLDELLDVLDGDEALQPVVRVDDHQLLDLVMVEHLTRLIERGPNRHRDEVLARHDVRDRPIDPRLEPQVAVRQDAHQPAFLAAVLGDRHAADAVFLHQIERLVDPVPRRERDRIHDHAALRALHLVHFGGLFLDAEVLVDDAHAAVLGHRNGQPALRHRVHGGAENGNVQPDSRGELGADVHLARQHRGVPRHHQDIVEGQRLGKSRRHLRRCTKRIAHRFRTPLPGPKGPGLRMTL